MLVLGQALQQQVQDLLGVANDVMVRLDVLVDLRPVDVDMDDLGLMREGLRLQRHPVGEPAAHGDQQVAVVAGHVGGHGAVHPDHAGGHHVPAGNAAATHHGDGHRRVDPADKLPEFLVGPAADHAAAADQHGLFGFRDHLHQLFHVVQIRLRHFQAAGVGPPDQRSQMPGGSVLLQRQRLVVALGAGHVPGDVDDHRTGAAAAGQCEGLPHRVRQLCHIPHQIGGFRNGHRNAGNVHLLKRVPADEVLGHVAGDKDHRGGIHVRGGDAGGQVRSAGAGGGEAHAHLAGAAGVAVRRVSGPLLMGGQNMGDLLIVI